MTSPTILIIDRSKLDRERSKNRFRECLDGRVRFVEAGDIQGALAGADGERVDCVVVSGEVADFDLDTLGALSKSFGPIEVPVVLMLDEDDRLAKKALDAGAQDIVSPSHSDAVGPYRAMRNALEIVAARRMLENQRQALANRTNASADRDPVTDLLTRARMRSHLSQILSHAKDGQAVGVALLGLDGFKAINSAFGHAVGDELLRTVTDRLRHCVRSADAVGRWGGDEFVAVLEDMSRPEDAAIVAQRIQHALTKPIVIEGQELYVTASVGIAIYPTDGEDGETLLRNADAAMYRVKRSGGNGHRLYSAQLNENLSDRLELGNRLRSALKSEEFQLYYQPQLDMTNGSVVGLEALLRWQDPVHGMRSPAEFIPVLEETGLIVPVGEWVLRKACTQTRAWHYAGLSNLRIAVNLSPKQFRQRELIKRVSDVLEETGLDANALELELTESSLMEDQDFALHALTEIKSMGSHVALDDFGTGHSSLALLKAFPVDTLKIDRAFIRNIAADEDDRSICSAIVMLGNALRLHVLAEGVEEEEQVEILKKQGCHLVQGFLYARPMPADDVWSWLTAETASAVE